MLGIYLSEYNINYYDCDKRNLKNNYRHISNWKLQNLLDILLLKKISNLDIVDLHPYLQITDEDVRSISRISETESNGLDYDTNSVKCAFTFHTQQDLPYNDCSSKSIDANLQKFLTLSSEVTSMQNFAVNDMSINAKCTNCKPKSSKPITLPDGKSLTKLDPDQTYTIEEETIHEGKAVLLNDETNIQNVLAKVNKRISKIAYPMQRGERLSKDDYAQVYKNELLALANIHKK